MVLEADFHEGQRVNASCVLVNLDIRDLRARQRQARAGLEAARVTVEVARVNRERMRSLHETGDIPRVQMEPAEVSSAQAKAAVTAARAALDELDVNESYASVRAPFSGIIVRKMTEVGNLVAPGQSLFTLEDDSQLRVTAAVGADLAAGLTPGQQLQVESLGQRIQGSVEGVVSSGDSRAPGLRVQVVMDNPRYRLKPGTLAVVEVPAPDRGPSAVLLPKGALLERGQLAGAFVVASDCTAHLRWLRIGEEREDSVRVLSGLREGDRVVLSPGLETVRDGQHVEEANP
jgi:RND family efflux transporter MFP subunit